MEEFKSGCKLQIEFLDGEVGRYIFSDRDEHGVLVRAVTTSELLFVPWSAIMSIVIEATNEASP